MEPITIAIIAWAVIVGAVIYTVVYVILSNRRMAKYYKFAAELEAQEDEWERLRLR